jgi:two-component system, LuxR family, sensor kinase FixL
MFKSTQAMLMRAAGLRQVLDAPTVIVGCAYLAGYTLLDWLSFIEPYAPFGVTPWSPNTGVSFVLILLFGRRMLPLLFVSPLLADLVNRSIVLPWTIEILSAALIGGGYSISLMLLKRSNVGFDQSLASMRDLVLLIFAAVGGALLVASSYISLMIGAELMSTKDFASATLSYWVGDVIGILGLTPFVLIVLTRRRILPMSAETAVQFAAIVGALMLVFGFAAEREFQLFYILFLPVVWIAVRTGIEGVSAGILFTQLGVILGVQLLPEQRQELTAFQALMLVLTVTGLVAGQLVSERRRMEAQLRLHHESLARLARLGSIGELAAAVAHEVNQPLMAAGTYARLVAETIESQEGDPVLAVEAAKKAVAQVDRATQVIRRLRALVRLDRSNRAPHHLEEIVRETITLCEPDLDRVGVTAQSTLPARLPPVMVDVLQIQQVLLNLLRNSIEAIGESGMVDGSILIEAKLTGAEFLEVIVADSGPGFPPERIETAFLPLSSNKPEGLGIGLSLCRSIIEAHGGKFRIDPGSKGGSVRFTLPIAMGHV